MEFNKICVIGSNSFSGSNFVNHALHSGYEVMGISRSSEPNPVFLPYKWEHNKLKDDIYKNLLPPLRTLDKTEEKDLINSLDKLNFSIKSLMAA